MTSILILLFSCQLNNKVKDECLKCADEKYLDSKTDTVLEAKALKSYKTRLAMFHENSILELNHEAYQLMLFNSYGAGKSIKFEKGSGTFTLSVKCFNGSASDMECNEYQVNIDQNDWEVFEKMIYEFNFWTAEKYRVPEDALDGYWFFIVGKRPEAEKCKKRTYQFVGRANPRYDKMDALMNNITEYEMKLKLKYDQMNEIKK